MTISWSIPKKNHSQLHVLKPQSKSQNTAASVSAIDVSQYPEPGVRYAGFAKAQINGGQWKLLRQDQWQYITMVYDTKQTENIAISGYPGRVLYLTQMQVTSISQKAPSGGHTQGFYLKSFKGTQGRVIWNWWHIENIDGTVSRLEQVHFDPPLFIDGDTLQIASYNVEDSSDEIDLVLRGFTEERP